MILVTVGTTPFDTLVKSVDHNLPNSWDIKLQIANGEYTPKHFEWFRFANNIHDLYEQAEFVICHAGAGTVLTLLDLRKKFVVVPNLERADAHQREVAEFLKDNHYAIVCDEPSRISAATQFMSKFDFKPFNKPPFSGQQLLLNLIYDLYQNADPTS